MKKKLFCFNPTKETWIAVIIGVVTILLSLALDLKVVEESIVASIFVRDILMIFGIGIVFVILRINKTGTFKEFGIKKDKWWLALLVNIVLAALLAFVMLSDVNITMFNTDKETLLSVAFIMFAGIFEVMLFYTYQRVVFEDAFGKIPAIILAAVFYSFHHAGFQPEFLKLIFVGIMYVAVVSISNNPLYIYPFFWGVGGTLDVLVQSDVVEPIAVPGLRTLILTVLTVVFLAIFILRKRKEDSQEKEEVVA